jgi:hypothetical protein
MQVAGADRVHRSFALLRMTEVWGSRFSRTGLRGWRTHRTLRRGAAIFFTNVLPRTERS